MVKAGLVCAVPRFEFLPRPSQPRPRISTRGKEDRTQPRHSPARLRLLQTRRVTQKFLLPPAIPPAAAPGPRDDQLHARPRSNRLLRRSPLACSNSRDQLEDVPNVAPHLLLLRSSVSYSPR